MVCYVLIFFKCFWKDFKLHLISVFYSWVIALYFLQWWFYLHSLKITSAVDFEQSDCNVYVFYTTIYGTRLIRSPRRHAPYYRTFRRERFHCLWLYVSGGKKWLHCPTRLWCKFAVYVLPTLQSASTCCFWWVVISINFLEFLNRREKMLQAAHAYGIRDL